MNHAVLYNIFLCWMVSLTSFLVARAIERRGKPERAYWALGMVWVSVAILWFLVGLRLLAYFFFLLTDLQIYYLLDKFAFYANEIFLASQLVFMIYFGAEINWHNQRINKILLVISSSCLLGYLGILYGVGASDYLQTPWGSEFSVPTASFYVFLPVYLISFVLMFFATIQGLLSRWYKREGPDWPLTVAAASLLIYGIAGIIDVKGMWGGWQLLLVRVWYLVAALGTFWVVRPADTSIRMIRRRRPS